MAFDLSGLKKLDTTGLKKVSPSAPEGGFDVSGLKKLDTSGLTAVATPQARDPGIMEREETAIAADPIAAPQQPAAPKQDDSWLTGTGMTPDSIGDRVGGAVDRIKSGFNALVQGAGTTVGGTAEGLALTAAPAASTIRNLDRIDAGRAPIPSFQPGTPMGVDIDPMESVYNDYQSADAEGRQVIRARFSDQFKKAIESPVFKAGAKIDKWVAENYPENPEFKGEFLTSKLPNALGSATAFIAGGVVTRGALGRAGSFVAPAVMGGAANRASQFEDAINSGADLATALTAAEIGGVTGLTEAIPIGNLLNRLDKGSGGAIRNYFKRVVKQGSEEAVQEAFTGVVNAAVAQGLYDPTRGVWTEDRAEEAALGFTSGAVLETLFSLLPGRQTRGGGLSAPGPESGPGPQADTMNPSPVVPEGAVNADSVIGPDPDAVKSAPLDTGELVDGIRGTAMREMPLPSTSDIDSPIPTDVINEGRAAVADAEATLQADSLLSEEQLPEVGTRVLLSTKDGEVSGSIVDAFETNIDTNGVTQTMRGAKIKLDSGLVIAEGANRLRGRLRRESDVPTTQVAPGQQGTVAGADLSPGAQPAGQPGSDLAGRAGSPLQGDGRTPATERPATTDNIQPAPVPSGGGANTVILAGQATNEQPSLERAPRTPIARQEPDNADDVAVTPTGREVPVRYAIVEASDLQASQTDDGRANPEFPAELQPRDRSRGVSGTQIQDIARNLNPRLIDRSPRATDGAPIVDDSGVVESGNGRVLGVRRAYADGAAQEYQDYLRDQGYPVEGFSQPVLVRVRQGDMTPADRAAFTREANQRDTLGMSATEQAMGDAAALDGRLLNLFNGGDVDAAANRDFVRAFMQTAVGKNDQAGMIAADGTISQDSIRRIQGALLAKAYGDADLVSSLIEATDSNIKAIGGALMDVSSLWASMRADVEAGQIDAAMDITDKLLEAVRIVQRARRESRSVAELVGQGDMLSNEGVHPVAEMILSLFFRNKQSFTQPASRERMAEALSFYVNQAENTSPGMDLLGESVTSEQILEGANERQYAEEQQAGQQADLLSQPDDSPSRSSAETREDRGEQAEPEVRRSESDRSDPVRSEPAEDLADPTDEELAAGPDTDTILLAKSGKPFATEKSAMLSATYKDLPYAEVVPVDGGFGVRATEAKTIYNPITNENVDRNEAFAAVDNADAPEYAAESSGANIEETKKIAAELQEESDQLRQDVRANGITAVMAAPEDGARMRMEKKADQYKADNGKLMTAEQADNVIAGWKRHAKAQNGSSINSDKVVLSLFDLSGEWARPWAEAGYDVYTFDIQSDPFVGDVNNFSAEMFADVFGDFDGKEVHAILAACPCTDFAVSGARHFAAKDADGRTVKSVELVRQTMRAVEYFKPAVWAVENPVGRIENLTGLPPWRMSFQPSNFGEDYTKRTILWGRFNADLPIAPTEATAGSKMHSQYGGKSIATKNARSETPPGFAYSFFMGNNAIDHPVMTIQGRFDQMEPGIMAEAVSAGMTEDQIASVIEDAYFQEQDYDAAAELLREEIDSLAPEASAPNLAASGMAQQVSDNDIEPTRAPSSPKERDEQQRAIYERRVEELSAEEARQYIKELRAQVLVDERTGLGSNRAWLNTVKKKNIASLDLDSLKWVNDNMGHEAGDQMIAAMGAALMEAGFTKENAFHISGDEFYVTHMSKNFTKVKLELAQKILATKSLTGEGRTFTRPTFSIGIGNTVTEAETEMQADKDARELSGVRAARGETPPGVVKAEEAAIADDRPAPGDRMATAVADSQAISRGELPVTDDRERQRLANVAAMEGAVTGDPVLTIEDYSEKSIIVRGDTKEHKDRIKAAASGQRALWNRKAVGWVFPKTREADVRESLSDLLQGAPAEATGLRGEALDGDWVAFSESSESMGVPRADMPQIKAEHRGALANFLKARGIVGTEKTVPARTLKPTQMEFSEAKVAKAKAFTGGDRAILTDNTGYVLDGHHQWVAAVDMREDIRIIQLDAPMSELLREVPQMPSVESSSETAPATTPQATNPEGLYVDFQGRRAAVESVADARDKWMQFRDESNATPEDIGGSVKVLRDGKTVAYVAFNGKLFSPDPGRPSMNSYIEMTLDADGMPNPIPADKLAEYRAVKGAAAGAVEASQPQRPSLDAPAQPRTRNYGKTNKVFTENAADIARATLKAKLSQLNTGIDPEVVQAGITLAGYHIEAGARSFAAFSAAMIEDLGTGVRPYLRSWYEGVRYFPGFETDGMSTAAEIETQEQDNGLQDAVSTSDAGARTQDDARAPARRDAGRAPSGEGTRSETDVRGPNRERTEAAERVPEGTTGERSRANRDGDTNRVQRPAVTGDNYVIQPGALEESRGATQKARDNMRAIQIVKAVEARGRSATAEEQSQLAQYVGWGGLKDVFKPIDEITAPGMKGVAHMLRDELNDQEYATARRSVQYAHYTAENVVRSMWSAVERAGFTGGKVFEPGMGTGNFAGLMPASVAAKSDYSGLELDHMTARIARLLYPKWGVRQDDFTRAPLPSDTFDVVIGNPPFADVAIQSDPKYPQGFLLHDYFFAKSMDAVRPGGVMMFITSAGTMNKNDMKARQYIADRADFIGGARLPGNAFQRNAGTSVTTDILMFRKKVPGETLDAAIPTDQWLETTKVTLPNKNGDMMSGNVNAYFAANPQMVFGEEGFFDPLYENRYGVRAPAGFDLDAKLAEFVKSIPADVMSDWAAPSGRAEIDFATSELKDGSFYIGRDGRLMQQRDGVGGPVQKRGKGVTGGKTAAELERIEAIVPVRDALRAVYAADLNDDTVNAAKARKRLNADYDAFVAKFGPINKTNYQYRRPSVVQQESARQDAREEARFNGQVWFDGDFDSAPMVADGAALSKIASARKAAREQAKQSGREFDEGSFDPDEMPDLVIEKRPNIDPFMDDPESYRLRSIEKYDETTETAKKSAIFVENILTKEVEPQIKSVDDAVLYSLNRFGRLDLPTIADKSGVSVQEAVDKLGNGIFRAPGSADNWVTADEYLSGNVRRKLRTARAAAERDPSLRRNVLALESAVPDPLPPSEIVANLGMPWIPTSIIEQFAKENLGLKDAKVSYLGKLAQWTTKGDKSSAASIQTYGTVDKNAIQLLSDALNRQDPKVYRETYVEGRKSRELDVVATEGAQDKLRVIKERFGDWVWSDTARAEELAESYNEEYNSIVVREFNGDYLTTPGISSKWSWRDHQRAVIARIIQSGNTYMAHGVGAGKTSAMIGAGMEMRRLGLVRKPMYAVPNHMLGQFTKEFYEQYPTARIAVADERRFHTDRRKQFIADVASDDLDAVIITHSAFGMIPISDDFQGGIISAEVDEYRSLLSEIKQSGDENSRITVSRVEKQIERLEQRLTGKGSGRKDQVFTFEEMGVDFVFMDEAHMFRKLDFSTKMSNVKGVSPQGSKAAWDLYVKTRYLESVNPGRNLVLASGTPVTNTMAELFTVSRYLQEGELKQRGLGHFDAWAGAFGDTVTNLEQDPSGGYKPVTRFAKFVNVPELSSMVRQVMDVVTGRQLSKYVTRPTFKDGQRKMNLAEPSDELQAYQQQLADRMTAIANRSGPPSPGDDIILSVINDGRHAAIDMRLVNPELRDDPGSKLNMLVANVFETWERTKRAKFYKPEASGYSDKPVDTGPAAQMIFANLGLSGSRGFSTTDFIRSDLVRRGVPKDQIANISDFKTHVAKQRLFNDVNEGKVRILIGSTAKMATGVNAQRRLIALHNLDPLWYPADDEQRIGRALRQGNMNPLIEINDYSTKGTYDSTMWGLMETKARFIQGFFEGDVNQRDMEDLGEASQYEQAKAMTTADPRLIELTQIRQDLDRLQRRKQSFEREQYGAANRIKQANEEKARVAAALPSIQADIDQRVDLSGDNFTMNVMGRDVTDRVEAGDIILGRIDAATSQELMADPLGTISGFSVTAEKYGSGNNEVSRVYLERNGGRQSDIRVSGSAKGLIQSMESAIRGFEADLLEYKERGRRADVVLAETDGAIKPFADDAKIADLKEQIREIERELTPAGEELTADDAVPGAAAEDSPKFAAAQPGQGGRSADQVRKDIAKVADGIDYEVVQSIDELPSSVIDVMRSQGIKSISGYYDPAQQRVYLVADGIKTKTGAQKTLMHEAIGHMGIEGVMGRDGMGEFLAQVLTSRKDPTLNRVWKRVDRQYSAASDAVKASEAVAILAEENPRHSLINRLIQWLKQKLRAAGFDVPFSRRDIIEALERSRQFVRSGQRGPRSGATAFAAEQSRGYEIDGGFYSKLEKEIAEATLPGITPSKRNPDGAARGADWLAYLKNRGIKQSEWEATGLRKFLEDNRSERFTQEDISNFAEGARTDIADLVATTYDSYAASDALFSELSDADRDKAFAEMDEDNVLQIIAQFETGETGAAPVVKSDITIKRSEVQGTIKMPFNYEVYSHTSNKHIVVEAHYNGSRYVVSDRPLLSENEARLQARSYIRIVLTAEAENSQEQLDGARWEEYVEPGSYNRYREIKIILPDVLPGFSNDVHFDEDNIVAFLRVTDRANGKSMFIEEAQSDWHQQGREAGYARADSGLLIEELSKQLREVNDEFRSVQIEVVEQIGELSGVSKIENDNWYRQMFNIAEQFHFSFPVIKPGLLSTRASVADLFREGLYREQPPAMPAYGSFIVQAAEAGDATSKRLIELAAIRGPLKERLAKESKKVPFAPFGNDEWINLIAKRAVIEAARGNYETVSWMTGRQMQSRWGDDFAELYENTYDKKMTSAIGRLLGAKPVKAVHSDGEYYIMSADVSALGTSIDEFMGPFSTREEAARAQSEIKTRTKIVSDVDLGRPAYWQAPISQEVRDRVLSDGLPMFRVEEDPTKPGRSRVMSALNSQPVDRTFRAMFDIAGGINEQGEWVYGRKLSNRAEKIIKDSKFEEGSRFEWMNGTLQHAREGLIDRYGLEADYVELDRQRGLDEQNIMSKVPEIMQQLSEGGVGTAEAKVLQAILTGEAVGEGQMAALAAPIRQAVDDMGAEAVQLGLISAESFERNRGAYLHRVYQKNEADQSSLARWVSQVSSKRRQKIIGNQFKGRGMWIEAGAAKMRKYVKGFDEGVRGDIADGEMFRVLDLVTPADQETAEGVEPAAQKVYSRVFVPYDAGIPVGLQGYVDRGMWEVRGKKGGDFVLWRDFTKAEREQMGEVVDARYTIAKTYMGMAHDLATGRFYRDIALNKDWSTGVEPKRGTWTDASSYNNKWGDPDIEWVRVPDITIKDSNTKRYGQMAGRYVRAEIWRDLHELDQMQNSGLWRTLMTQWKLNKTARNPVVHLNNVLSNMILMDIADVSSADLVRAARSMVKKDADYRDAVKNGAFGADMVAQEIRSTTLKPILEELEAELKGTNSTEVRGRVVGRVIDAIWSRGKRFDRAMTSAYQMEDEVFRMATYLRRKRDGATPEQAAVQARDQFLNYDIRAPWVNAARRSVLPFISYTYRAVPILAQSIMLRPWKVAKYSTMAFLANSLAYMAVDEDDDDEDLQRRSMRDTEQGSTWIGAPRMIRMPYSDDLGNPVFLDIRRWIPAGDVFDMNQGHGAFAVPAWLQFGGPLMLAAELALNKQAFTGEEITNDKVDDMWDRTAKISDWAWKSWMPSAAWVPGSWYWTKIGDAIGGGQDAKGDPYSVPQAVSSSLGIKLRPIDTDQNFFWKSVEFNQIERELKGEMSQYYRRNQRGLLSDKDYEKRQAKIIDKLNELNQRRKETFLPGKE